MHCAPTKPSRLFLILALGLLLGAPLSAQRPSEPPAANASLTVKSTPGAIVWVDAVRYGAIPAGGVLTISHLRAGARTVRVRLQGKRELSQPVVLAAGATRSVSFSLTAPADEAELRYQTAEELRERGDQKAAIKEYRQAIKLRGGNYAAARVGLARSLQADEQYEEAVAEAQRAAREHNSPFPEAHTVLANVRRAQGLYDEALASYRTALAQAHDFSPEAHTGVALTYEELNRPEEAVKHFRLAAAQGGEAEPVIYFLLGSLLERQSRAKEAVAAYEKYLQLEPEGKNASAVRSVLKQLRREVQQD